MSFYNTKLETAILRKFKAMHNNRVLIIGLVWPEPGSSAAGTRMVQLVQLFQEHGHEVTFASAASKSAFSYELKSIGVAEEQIRLNDESFNNYIHALSPAIVMFDRYMSEEQYGWRVQQECPDAMTILDTEDLHCLRHARQQAYKKTSSLEQTDMFNETAKREIASILRSDLSLIISEIEMQLLVSQFQVDASLLYYLPFLEETLTPTNIEKWSSYEDREGFTFIGNYLHEPNWHTLQILKMQVWPMLGKLLPHVKLHIYGAYAGQKVLQMHNERERFYVHGRAADARLAMARHRILLAPIKFGAGVKGKFIDAMRAGTPAVTTSTGAEAMNGTLPWNGIISDEAETFAIEAAKLYQDKVRWQTARENGIDILNTRHTRQTFAPGFMEKLQQLLPNLFKHRQKNFIGQILQHQTLNSLKYMSLWIEEKNRPKQ